MIDQNNRIVHILHADGREVVTVKVPGAEGYIGYHWSPPRNITFGHGVTREEALLEVADKVRRRQRQTLEG